MKKNENLNYYNKNEMRKSQLRQIRTLIILLILVNIRVFGQENKKLNSEEKQVITKKIPKQNDSITEINNGWELMKNMSDSISEMSKQIDNLNNRISISEPQKDSNNSEYSKEFWLLLITAFSAIGTALFTLWIAIKTRDGVNENLRINKFLSNLEMLYRTENSIYAPENIDSLIKLHGISKSEIDDAGLTLSEFEYINKSLKASLVYYIIDSGSDTKLSDYRKTFLSNPKVKSVYDLVRGRFLSNTKFIEILDDYYERNPVHTNEKIEKKEHDH